MIKTKFLLNISFILLVLGAHSQDGEERVYCKVGTGNSFGLSANELDFPMGANSVFVNNYRPGSGYNIYFGIGVRLSDELDLEVTLEQAMQFNFTQTTSNGSSFSTFQSFFRTHLHVGAFYNLPTLPNGANVRLTAGAFYTLPSKGTFKADGDTWGTFRLKSGPGFTFGGSLIAPLGKIILEPGLRVKIASLDVKESSFDDPDNQITSGNISSVDILVALIF